MKNINDLFSQPIIVFLQWLSKQLIPPRVFSSQTLILLSIYSLAMGLIATGFTRRLILGCCWMFLMTGVTWLMNDKPVRVGDLLLNYWIVGILICLFVFVYLLEEPQQYEFWVMLPLVVMIITTISEFTDQKLELHIPNVATRQKLVTLLMIHLLISCWLQFFFFTNNLLNRYADLISEDFNNSIFIIKLPLIPTPQTRGERILNSVIPPVKVKLNNQPWQTVEPLLQSPTRDLWIRDIWKDVAQRAPVLDSKIKQLTLWDIDIDSQPESGGYKLELSAVWQGPSYRLQGFRFTSTCEIRKVDKITPNPTNATNNNPNNKVSSQILSETSSTSKIECEEIKKKRSKL